MSAASASPLGDLAADNVAGQVEADLVLGLVERETAHPDALHTSAMKTWANHGTAGLVGFHRRLQKALERAA